MVACGVNSNGARQCIAIATLSIGYGICYVSLSGQFHVEFPKTFDTLAAGFVGFLTGFLGLSFVTLAICLSPLSQVGFCKMIGLSMAEQTTNTAYVYWWCDWMHAMVGGGVPRSSDEAVSILLMKATKPAAAVANVQPPAPPRPAPVAQPAPQPVVASPKPDVKAFDIKEPESQADVAAVPQEAKPAIAVDPYRRPGESWQEEIARRRVLANSPDDVAAAIANPEVKIVEIADACTADKFDPKQIELFQRWASEGGVVWANNDALTLFGINHSKLVWWGGALDCAAPEAKDRSAILGDYKKVVLKDAGGKAHALSAKGAVPLLGLEKDIPFEDKAGTACWSLVPYGKGWVSDPKPVDTMQYDGGQFWPNFCHFCLGRPLMDATSERKPAGGGGKPTPPATPQGPLSGTWQASTGAKFRIDDDGDAVTISGIAGDILQSFTGTLVRRNDDQASTSLAGRVDAVFTIDAHKKYAIALTATASDSDSMRVRCEDWPVWNNKGKYLGTRPGADVWTRSESPHK